MESKTNYTGREVIVSNFEVYPFDPEDCEFSGFPKGVCQLVLQRSMLFSSNRKLS